MCMQQYFYDPDFSNHQRIEQVHLHLVNMPYTTKCFNSVFTLGS